jgi:carboxyl-terminal processing protease
VARLRRQRAGALSRRTWAALALLALLVGSPQARQSWREPALSSFDEVWQTINDNFFDPSFGGLDWNGVHDELRPRAEAATSVDGVRTVIREMLARLERSHFVLIPSSSAESGTMGSALVPIEIRVAEAGLVVTRVEPDSTASRAGLRPGQVILSIDDETSASWREQAVGDDARRRDLDVWRLAWRALHGSRNSRATLRLRDPGGREHDVEVERAIEGGELVRFGNLPPLRVRVESDETYTPQGRRVGVLAFNTWMAAAGTPLAEAVDRYRDADGLVLDLRGNMGGLVQMIRGVAGHLLDEPISLGRMETRYASLELFNNPRRSTADGRSVEPFAGPVALLVDELTASASECFAGGLQSLGRVRVFGRQTMGQALPAATRTLANRDVLMYVVGDFVTPTGVQLEGEGVRPDEVVPLSIEALAAGRDLSLEAALGWMDLAARGERRPVFD